MDASWLLLMQLVVILFGTVVFSWWLQRRLGTGWGPWTWGAVAFVASQAARLPVVAVISFLAQQAGLLGNSDQAMWFNALVLLVTSGLFEEMARYLVLRGPGKKVRQWREGVVFGVGHGGIEAILIFGSTGMVSLYLLAAGQGLVEQVAASSPEQAQLLATQIEAIRALGWKEVLLGSWERVPAIAFHTAASLLVLRSVREENRRWLLAAILLHIFFNTFAILYATRMLTLEGVEGVMTVAGLFFLFLILRLRSVHPESDPSGT